MSQGAIITWTNGVGGSWANAANWSPNQVPGPSDIATITNGSGYTVSLDTTATIAGLSLGGTIGTQSLVTASTLTVGNAVINPSGALRLEGGSVNASSPVTLNGVLNWNSGQLNGSLTVSSNGLARLSTSGFKGMNGGTLTNAGTVLYGGSGSLGLATATIYNLAGALFDLQNDGNIYYWFGGQPSFYNSGLLRKSTGAGTSSFGSLLFSNTGTVEVQTGTINFNTPSVFAGQYQIATGAELNLFGGGTITGTFNTALGGTVTFSGGNFGVSRYPSARMEPLQNPNKASCSVPARVRPMQGATSFRAFLVILKGSFNGSDLTAKKRRRAAQWSRAGSLCM